MMDRCPDAYALLGRVIQSRFATGTQFDRILELAGWFAQYYATRERYFQTLVSQWSIVPPSAVCVLSAAAERLPGGGFKEDTDENVARIQAGVHLWRRISTISMLPATLILNGESEQLQMMEDVASQYMDRRFLRLVDCGKRGVGNTATQFDAMGDMGLSNLVAVTSDYHVARVILTAKKRLPKVRTDVVGVPFGDCPFDIAGTMVGEIRRILDHADRGDIASERELVRLFPCPAA